MFVAGPLVVWETKYLDSNQDNSSAGLSASCGSFIQAMNPGYALHIEAIIKLGF